MEPLGAAASVVNLLQGTAVLVGYLKDLKTGGEQRQQLQDEVTSFWAVLSHLKEKTSNSSTPPQNIASLDALHQPGGTLEQCQEVVNRLRTRLEPAKKRSGKVLQSLQWSFSKDEVQRNIDQLHRFQTTINGALAQASLLLSQHILDNSFISKTLLEESERDSILQWLSSSNSSTQQAALSTSCCPGTGMSLIESQVFRSWVQNPGHTLWCRGIPGTGKTYLSAIAADHLRTEFPDALVLVAYCQHDDPAWQKPSNIFGDLCRQSLIGNPPPDSLIKIYRKAKASVTKLSLETALEILAEQVTHYERVFIILDAADEVLDLNDRHMLLDQARSPKIGANLMVNSRGFEDIEKCLEPCYHLCDGCQFDDYASNPHIPNLYHCFGGCYFDACESCYKNGISCPNPTHFGLTRFVKNNFLYDVWTQAEDLKRYVEWRLGSDVAIKNLIATQSHLQSELIEATIHHSTGLFLLTRLLLDSIASCLTAKQFRKTILQIPATLNIAYESTLRRIDQQHPEWARIAYETMAWMAYAVHPLSAQEIEHALAIQLGTDDFDVDDIVPSKKLVDLCCGLVFIDASNRFRFVHTTVREHVTTVIDSKVEGGENLVARKCLTYLQFSHLGSGASKYPGEVIDRVVDYPLLPYCARHWARHCQQGSDDETTKLAWNLLNEGPHWLAAFQMLSYLAREGEYPPDMEGTTAFHYVSLIGAFHPLNSLLSRSTLDMDKSDALGLTPLMFAAFGGHADVLERLLEAGVSPNSQDNQGNTALHKAADRGHLEIVDILIRSNFVDLDLLNIVGDSAMTKAFSQQHGELAMRLLQAGADVNASSNDGYTALGEAIRHASQYHHIRALLEQPQCDVNRFSNTCTPLVIAAGEGHVEVVHLLLGVSGINVNTQSTVNGWTALMLAISNAHTEVALLLLDDARTLPSLGRKFLDPNRNVGYGWTALFYAVNLGDETVFDALLAKGVSFDIVTKYQWTPFLVAAWANRVKLLARLLALQETQLSAPKQHVPGTTSTPVNILGSQISEDTQPRTRYIHERSLALHYAVHRDNAKMVEMLLLHGARLDFRHSSNLTALEHALYWNDPSVLAVFSKHVPDHPLLLARGHDYVSLPNSSTLVQSTLTLSLQKGGHERRRGSANYLIPESRRQNFHED